MGKNYRLFNRRQTFGQAQTIKSTFPQVHLRKTQHNRVTTQKNTTQSERKKTQWVFFFLFFFLQVPLWGTCSVTWPSRTLNQTVMAVIWRRQIKSRTRTEKSFTNLIKSNRNQIVFTFSDWFGINRTSDWFQINQKMVNTIWFRFDLIRIRKDFSVCTDKFTSDYC